MKCHFPVYKLSNYKMSFPSVQAIQLWHTICPYTHTELTTGAICTTEGSASISFVRLKQSKSVLPAVVRVPNQELWGPIPTSGHIIRVDFARLSQSSCKTEVTHFNDSWLANEYVFRLNITMDNLQTKVRNVKVRQCPLLCLKEHMNDVQTLRGVSKLIWKKCVVTPIMTYHNWIALLYKLPKMFLT